jgi:hypothetical protein
VACSRVTFTFTFNPFSCAVTRQTMNVQCYIVTSSPNHCYRGNSTVCFVFIFVDVYVAVSNVKVFSISMEM